jgi:SPP1 family predicted phage head-tail adaptor
MERTAAAFTLSKVFYSMIGILKNRVLVKKETKVANGRGGFSTNEVDIGERWAAILPMSSRELAQYMQKEKEADTRILMRRDPAIDSSCVIYYGNYRFYVDQVIDRLDHSNYMDLITRKEVI